MCVSLHLCTLESLRRVPLIMRVPWIDGASSGKRTKALAELVDVYQTVCDVMGVPTPPNKSLYLATHFTATRYRDLVFVSNHSVIFLLEFLNLYWDSLSFRGGPVFLYRFTGDAL